MAQMLLLVALGLLGASAQHDPVADPKAIVFSQDGTARFTVLTSALIRMEWSQHKQFEDQESYSFVNRRLPVPKFTVTRPTPTSLVIETDDVVMTYKPQVNPVGNDTCTTAVQGHDAVCNDFAPCSNYHTKTQPTGSLTQAQCCDACNRLDDCNVWIHGGDNCWTLTQAVGTKPASDRTVGGRFNQGFTNETLSVLIKSTKVTWSPGTVPTDNLLGTVYSLDGVTGAVDLNCTAGQATVSMHCTLAPFSRSGWALYDDTGSWVIDNTTEWLATRPMLEQDMYLFGHGLDYKRAIADFIAVAGPVPSIPRFVLGVWWSRYWPYTAEDLEDIAVGYRQHGVPLDILVSDMAWHFHNESSIDWGGYQWSPSLFPEPDTFKAWLAANDLHTVLNLHLRPIQAGVAPSYPAFAQALGLNPNGTIDIPSANLSFPYNQSVANLLRTDKKFAEAYLNIALDDVGMNWWWLDDDPHWVARMLYEHSTKQRGEGQGLTFSRWGGLGSHRYPIGFSGDVFIHWDSLAFQTTFTVRSANVLFWWSHDIGGHRSEDDQAYDGELYLRWLQWGAYAPILRTHPKPDPLIERRPYGWPLPLAEYMMDAMRLRARHVPQLHTALENFTVTGLSPLRGLYIEHPDMDGAYAHNDSYFFCDHLFAAPVTSPVRNDTGLANKTFWIPPGTWIDTVTQLPVTGSVILTKFYTLWEIPVYARAGYVQALGPEVDQDNAWGYALNAPRSITWRFWLGDADAGSGFVTDQVFGRYSVEYTLSDDATTIQIDLKADQAREAVFEFPQTYPIESVTCADADITLTYDARTLTNTLVLASTVTTTTVTVKFQAPVNDKLLTSVPFAAIRKRAHVIKQTVDLALHNPSQVATRLYVLVNSAQRINANATAATVEAELKDFKANVDNAMYLLTHSADIDQDLRTKLKAWLTM
eukprot:TRINITY_DN10355_c0_g1_i2.p1 TRINITY_DN10355_c0_g1~~TRINITY_DN10355_c0_g1_i2.p1  ORF type:complete len:932 (+),score=199.62 TRINITY_DN10355_c0_g1_i2:23-2797(+)